MDWRVGSKVSLRDGAAMWVLAAASVVALAPTAQAQDATRPATKIEVAQAATDKTYSLDIAGKPLPQAMTDLSTQTGVKVLYTEALPFQRQAPAIKGSYTVEQALRLMLTGSGLGYRFTAPNAVTLEVTPAAGNGAIVLGRVQVEAQNTAPGANPYADPAAPYKVDRLSSSKFTEPLLDTPRTVTVLTKEALDDKNATTLREVARSTAGVTLGSGEGGNAFGDRFFIRGFDARNDIFVDGVRDPGVGIRENFDVEQIEILRGPASSFAGRGTTGGAINIVTKEAQDRDFYRVEATGDFVSEEKRGQFDINKAVSDKFDFRFNAMAQESNVAGRDFTTDDRWGLAGAATLKLTDNFKIKAGYSHTELTGLPDFGVPYDQVTREPVTEHLVPRDTYYGVVNRDFTKSVSDMGTVDAEWRVNDWVTLENKFRRSQSLLNYIGTIPENPSATGATKPYSSTATFFSGYVQLNAQSRYEPVNVLGDEPQATFKFVTGPVSHTVVTGGEFSTEKVSIDSYTGLTSELTTGPIAFASSGAPIVSVFDPTHYVYTAATPKLSGNPTRYRVNTTAGYLMDTANYHDFVFLNGGLRYDDYSVTSQNNTSARSENSGITSWNGGLTVKPLDIASVYFAYATAAEPVGDELDSTSSAYGGLSPTQNAAQIYGPQKSKSYEFGTKWELFEHHLLATAAAFETDVTNARETAPAGIPGVTSGTIIAGAEYRVRGLDFEIAGKITDKWSAQGGLVFLDTDITKSVNPNNVGLQLANIAHQSFNMLSKYQVTDWLELGGQSVYASQIKGGSLLAANGGAAYPNPPNPTLLPSHWRFDVFAETKINDMLQAKLYAQNIFDKTYYDALYQSAQPFIQVAPGRSVSISLTAKF